VLRWPMSADDGFYRIKAVKPGAMSDMSPVMRFKPCAKGPTGSSLGAAVIGRLYAGWPV
jgi:hypothetical protein